MRQTERTRIMRTAIGAIGFMLCAVGAAAALADAPQWSAWTTLGLACTLIGMKTPRDPEGPRG